MDHGCDGCSVLSIEISVNLGMSVRGIRDKEAEWAYLVEEVEWCWVTLLDGKH